ncbi:P-II family nitrogen regulator [soil metagenome]
MVHLITAIVKPHRLEEVKDALRGIGISGMTVTEVKGVGRQGGHTETYRGTEYTIDLVPQLTLVLLCDSTEADNLADSIGAAARAGSVGDGKIWIAAADRAIRVRTGELDSDAL